jgi:cytochrome P450
MIPSNSYKTIRSKLQRTLIGDYQSTADQEHGTIFAAYLNNDLPPEEKTENKIMDTATLLVGSGFETTSYTLSTAHYHILANPSIYRRLKAELGVIWPSEKDSTVMPSWKALEQIPYLRAVIIEALRMSMGAMSRLARVNHSEIMQYRGWKIPKHTPVGMSQYLIHYNENLFPSPRTFDPERWLQGEKSKNLERYVVAFSKGSRGCIGEQYVFSFSSFNPNPSAFPECRLLLSQLLNTGCYFSVISSLFGTCLLVSKAGSRGIIPHHREHLLPL